LEKQFFHLPWLSYQQLLKLLGLLELRPKPEYPSFVQLSIRLGLKLELVQIRLPLKLKLQMQELEQ
jgi:hypothetical protein